MKTETIQDDNRLIAEFMKHTGRNALANEFQKQMGLPEKNYSNSWDWLMPVVERIEQKGGDVAIYFTTTSITHSLMNEEIFKESYIKDGNAKRIACYKAVIEFIKWYNLNK